MHGGSGGFSRGGFAGGSFRGGYGPPPSRGNSVGPGFRGNFRHGNRPFFFPRNRFFFPQNRFFPYRGFPFVWGYPYLWPSIFDDWDNWGNFDSQQTGNYAAQQPSCNGSGVCPYQPQPDQYRPQPDDQDNPPAGEQAQPSSSYLRAPDQGAQAPFQPSGALVFKNGNILEYKWVTPKTAHGSR